jgi:hypothetical protein
VSLTAAAACGTTPCCPWRSAASGCDPSTLPSGPLPGGRLALGAALFRAPELRLRAVEDGPHGRGFLAEGFPAADIEATIERQATAAFADGCFGAVWPELTMPPEARQALSRHLALEALRQCPDRPLRLVLAGSWHEPREEGSWSNTARILGRTGEVLCSYAKFAAFHNEAWGRPSARTMMRSADNRRRQDHLLPGSTMCDRRAVEFDPLARRAVSAPSRPYRAPESDLLDALIMLNRCVVIR